MILVLDAGDYVQLADFWKRGPDVTRTRLLQAITTIDDELQAALNQDESAGGLPRGAGSPSLAGSVATDEQAFDDNVIGVVSTSVAHALYVEMGTDPHPVSLIGVQAIEDWVKVKFGLLDQAAHQMAEAVAWKIRKHGTKANPVWQRTWASKQAFIRETFDACMVAIAGDLSGGESTV